jgi:glutamine amidotransferase
MMKFCGVFASDHRQLRCAVSLMCPVCAPEDDRSRGRMGLGYYSGDEVLLMRRPVSADFDLVQFIGPAMGNHLLYGVDDSAAAQFRLENTPPWRFRNHLGMFSVGPIKARDFAERLRFHLPEYLTRDIHGDSAGELLFHLYLSYVHDLGRIDARGLPASLLVDAVRSTLSLFPKLLDPAPVPPIALCVTNGQHLVAAALSTDLWMRSVDGIVTCPLCSDGERPAGIEARPPDHPMVKVVSFAHLETKDAPPGYTRVPAGQVVAATSTGEILSRSI